nr:hypothetical protein [Sicyoidochytrium minutum DNA virus]
MKKNLSVLPESTTMAKTKTKMRGRPKGKKPGPPRGFRSSKKGKPGPIKGAKVVKNKGGPSGPKATGSASAGPSNFNWSNVIFIIFAIALIGITVAFFAVGSGSASTTSGTIAPQ